jgi:hypothetical protein
VSASVYGLDYTGLREAGKALAQAGVTDAAIKDAMQNAGAVVAQEALRISPNRTGRMDRTLKVNRSKSNLTITVGNNTTVPYAYTLHAVALGKSRGGFTFRVRAHTRQGHQVKAYKAQRYIRNDPFMFIAWERKKQAVYEAFVTAFGHLFDQAAGRG